MNKVRAISIGMNFIPCFSFPFEIRPITREPMMEVVIRDVIANFMMKLIETLMVDRVIGIEAAAP